MIIFTKQNVFVVQFASICISNISVAIEKSFEFITAFTSSLTQWIFLYSSYSPNAREEPPRWASALCALGLFIYQSLDAIDGKQARRTNSSNPLGELFDHGCDSISTVFVALSACISVRLGFYPKWMFFQVSQCGQWFFGCAGDLIRWICFSVSVQWHCFIVPIGRPMCLEHCDSEKWMLQKLNAP